MKHEKFIRKLEIIIEDISEEEVKDLAESMNIKLQELTTLSFNDYICEHCHNPCNTHKIMESDTSEHFGNIATTTNYSTVSTCHDAEVF